MLAFGAVYIPQHNVAEIDGNSVVLDSINLFFLVSVIITLLLTPRCLNSPQICNYWDK